MPCSCSHLVKIILIAHIVILGYFKGGKNRLHQEICFELWRKQRHSVVQLVNLNYWISPAGINSREIEGSRRHWTISLYFPLGNHCVTPLIKTWEIETKSLFMTTVHLNCFMQISTVKKYIQNMQMPSAGSWARLISCKIRSLSPTDEQIYNDHHFSELNDIFPNLISLALPLPRDINSMELDSSKLHSSSIQFSLLKGRLSTVKFIGLVLWGSIFFWVLITEYKLNNP